MNSSTFRILSRQLFRASSRATTWQPSRGTLTLVGAMSLASFLAMQDGNTEGSVINPNKAMSEASTSTSSSSNEFKLQAALEYKEEMQKLKLARFLHELMEVANKQKKKSLKKYKTEWLVHEEDHGTIDMRGIDVPNIKTGEAMYIMEQIQNGGKLGLKAVVQICQAVTKKLMAEESLIDKTTVEKVTVVGDLHGSLQSLRKVVELAGDFRGDPQRCIVFDGDFVDRGEDSLEVFLMLLLLKIAIPDQVILIRGNHEDSMVAKVYGFSDELRAKYHLSDAAMEKLWKTVSATFASLPLGVVTDTAFIVHGGLPNKQFRLKDLRKLTADERTTFPTLVHPISDKAKMIEALLWSDPTRRRGIHPSPRGTGVKFGRDVAHDFLVDEKLKYIVRGHEPVEEGVKELDCGDGMKVVTVFSAANYPNEEGHNVGALIHLTGDGEYSSVTYNYRQKKQNETFFSPVYDSVMSFLGSKTKLPPEDRLRSYVSDNRSRLLRAFKSIEKDGLVTKQEWALTMEKVLQLGGSVSWEEIQPQLAPTTTTNGDQINWREYLIEHTTDIKATLADKEKMGKTVDWKDKMLVIFEFLDLDMDGVVDIQDFIAGTRLLNRHHLPKIRQISDPVELFSRFDDDHDGILGLIDFEEHLAHSHIVSKMSKMNHSVGKQQVKSVVRNVELLTTAFEFMDKDGNGTINFEEWKAGIDLLNKQLHRNEKVYDAKELFMMMDIDGSGEIDLEEFKDLFGAFL